MVPSSFTGALRRLNDSYVNYGGKKKKKTQSNLPEKDNVRNRVKLPGSRTAFSKLALDAVAPPSRGQQLGFSGWTEQFWNQLRTGTVQENPRPEVQMSIV